MTRWAIERHWRLHVGSNGQAEGATSDLIGRAVCCLLGSAGIGKTVELKRLEELERDRGYDVRHVHLAEVATSADRLNSALDVLADGATGNSVLCIDAVDEAMVPVAWTGRILADWVRHKLKQSRPLLRISCRSAIWPPVVQAAISEVYGEDAVTLAVLELLTDSDVVGIAGSLGLDGNAFSHQVTRANAGLLARQPLTLQMLIRLFQRHRGLPASRSELYSQAVYLLASERVERRAVGTAVQISPEIILEAAERLACYTILSGREAVDLSDDPSPSCLGLLEIATLPALGKSLDDQLLRAIGQSGLCEGNGPHRFRFIHRQIAEYLAGRRIAKLLSHQSRSLLCSGLGWRAGVAGPLRETAAFAAIENAALARWVSESDPEVIGLSDVADNNLRRQATLRLLERFRRRELTDTHVARDLLPLAGLEYTRAEQDLKPVLRERWNGCEDVLEFAIELAESWKLTILHGALADLTLDPSAPLHPRVSAGYVIARFGDREVRTRLRTLIAGSEQDPDEELKGIALRSCWPEDLTTTELLAALHPLRDGAVHGAYFGFLVQLNREEFSSAEDRVGGLAWAKSVLLPGRSADITAKIVQRIAHGALEEVDDPAVAAALVDLILESAAQHSESPLRTYEYVDNGSDQPRPSAPLVGRREARRIVLEQLVARAAEDTQARWVAYRTPGLLALEDFGWMLECACSPDTPEKAREAYAELAQLLPMHESYEAVEAWLRYREREPVRSKLYYPLFVELGSDQAVEAKKHYDMSTGGVEDEPEPPMDPLPRDRVLLRLEQAETKDPRFFFYLCLELTLDVGSRDYELERFLTETAGWKAADAETRTRIVECAKRQLTAPSDEAETARDKPLSSILQGYIEAAWLLLDAEPSWLENMPPEWWAKWSWYFLRELRPNFSGEPDEPKARLFKLLNSRSPGSTREAISELSKSSDPESQNLLVGLLELAQPLDDNTIDGHLEELLRESQVGTDRTWHIMRFLLGRNYERGIALCRDRFGPGQQRSSDDHDVDIVTALLHERTADAWEIALSYLRAHVDLAKRVLAKYAHIEPRGERQSWREHINVSPHQIGQLVAILLEHYPPESDSKHTGAFWVTDEDSAVLLRGQLISWLGEQNTAEAVQTLRHLEQQFGTRYPWLRRPRSAVERAHRQASWSSIPPASVASLLLDNSKRLIRSGPDAMEGVVAAIEDYEWRLHHESPSPLEDLWNTPKGHSPTPKIEERISDKLCEAIRTYFRENGVAADREVQVFRRTIPVSEGGAPGSEVDVLVTVPAVAVITGDPISIPVEVKRSMNREAKTGLREQLVDRYMSQLGTSHGVFVVVWLDAPDLPSSHKPVWKTIAQAKEELGQQASELAKEFNGAVDVAVKVVDASLQ